MNSKEAFFKKITDKYLAEGKKPILMESSLRLEVPIDAATQEYEIPLLFSDVSPLWNVIQKTEKRLQKNDNFHIRDFGFYIANTTAVTDTDFRLKTYPNEIELGAAVALSTHQVYNGVFNINVQSVNVLQNYRLSSHYYVPQTQRLSVAAATNRDQIDLEENGIIPMAPSIMLSGEYTNKLTIKLPTAVTGALAGNLQRMVLIFDGLNANNASQPQNVNK